MRDKVSPVLVMAKVRETLREFYTMWQESNCFFFSFLSFFLSFVNVKIVDH